MWYDLWYDKSYHKSHHKNPLTERALHTTGKSYYRKKGTVVWPAMFFGGFKLQPEIIMTQKKKYSRLADG